MKSSDEIAKSFQPDELAALYHEQIARSRAVGKDGVRHFVFQNKLAEECLMISKKAIEGSYRFTTYREKLISRGAARTPRQISIPTIRDRLTLRAVCNALKDAFPEANTVPPHIYIRDCATEVRKSRENSSFIRMDVKEFYPSIIPTYLLQRLSNSKLPQFVVELVKQAISTGTGESHSQDVGVPQGLSISNALAAIYLKEFDDLMVGDFFYRRYVDDILIICPTEKTKDIYSIAYNNLAKFGLKSHPMGTIGKTEETRLQDGAQYLGYILKPQRISVRDTSYRRMFKNLARIFTQIKYNKLEEKYVFRLNLKITGCIVNNTRRGWLMFFSQTEDKSQLRFLDEYVKKNVHSISKDKSNLNVKTFIKTYHEIRYNMNKTTYIPNFDQYDLNEMAKLVSLLGGYPLEEVQTRSAEVIESEFNKLLSKEIAELEKDVAEAFS